MNTPSKTAIKLNTNEAKTLESFEIISPSVETSSSTVKIESITAHISSKSSSPFNALGFKDSSRLSPLSEATVTSYAGDLKTKSLLKSPTSSGTRSPIDSPLLPFLNDTYHHNKQQIQQRDIVLNNRFENMLSSSSNNNQQTPPTTTTGGVLLASNASSPTNSIKNIKCEPFSTLSPLNDSVNSKNMLDETHNNNNLNGASTNAIDTAVKRDRDCPTTSTTTSTSIVRQNSNSTIKSCPNTVNASSPNNGSDHSNSSSNISSNLSQAKESNADILQDLNKPEKCDNKKKSKMNNLATVKEDDGVKSSVEKNVLTGSSTKNVLCTTTAILSSAKEETIGMNNLMNVKKEEGIVSPDISPAGFGSIANLSGSNTVDVRSCTPVKQEDVANTKTVTNCNNNSTNSNNHEKIVSILGSMNNGSSGCAENSLSVSDTTTSLVNTSTDSCVGGSHHSSGNVINSNHINSGTISNCMEYMQQQNHIFVFSTQLANKGAESVLSGQFPTIIAYHCTQPATKDFLEDFFIKNPLKMSKLQRQNLCNITVGSGQQWVGGCNALPKLTQKSNVNKINFSAMAGNLESKLSLRQSNIPNFNEVSENLNSNENEIMCWEQGRNNMEGSANDGHTALKMTNGVDGVVDGGPHAVSKSLAATEGVNVNNDNSTPSLQGIKVPDENLTPQQRQHREEQLAKLKQIDKFLSNPLQGAGQLGKLNSDGVPANIPGLMLNLPNTVGIGPQITNQLNPNVRHMPSNVMNANNHNICNPENMPAALGDGNIPPPDILSTHEINNLTNKSMHMNNQSSMQCGRNGIVGIVPPSVSVSNMTRSSLPCHTGGNNTGNCVVNSNITGAGGLMPNSPEIINNFIGEGNLNSNSVKIIGPIGLGSQEMAQAGMAQMEWSKLQHQFFEERIKGNKGQGQNDVGCMPTSLCRSNSASMRPNISGSGAQTVTASSCQSIRSTQGPPPPYHPTQRSASVPIATQSPNPASPNNPTSNLSLPSPRTTGALGITANSPNMDVHAPTMPTTLAVTATTSTVSTAISNSNGQSKNNFPSEGSPTSSGTNNSTTNTIVNRNRNNQMNQFNSNPSTPLSHLSPKDLDSFHTNVQAGDLKSARPSPQRSRTPLIGSNNGNIADAGNIDGRFLSASPGLNFPQPMPTATSSNSGVNSYKGPGQIERQNSAPVPSQFSRRTDNLPLNPNSNRPTQSKLNHSFDPISSLAQMSQQLTSCVSLNAGNGGGVGNMGVIAVNDVNVPNNINQNLETMMASIDTGLDHCNAGSSGNMGMSPHISGPVPFMSNNCHINSMLGSMGQRLLNPKMCGSFNPANGGIGRDAPSGLHGVIPNHRMMSRMPMNFSNFNVSSNIQVKASTPNTIQYMPIRAQNNNNSNIRVPPSLEFLRYANPQMAGAGNMMDNGHIGQGNAGASSEQGKINNCNNGPAGAGNTSMNFFGNCMEQEDMSGGNIMSSHEMNMSPHSSMIRGMRPIRQHMGHSGSQIIPAPRMQAPGVAIMPGHFPNGPQDPMECVDNSMFCGNNANGNVPVQGSTPGVSGVSGQGPMYPGGNSQQKSGKTMSANIICQNMNISNISNNGQISANANLLPNEHNSSMQSPANGPIMIGNNSNMLSNAIQVGNSTPPVGCAANGGNGPVDVGNVGYKPFVGPASNDLKYAQQYHSFQQQLYATSTRSQQNTGNTNIGSNVSANPSYFVNK
ncbi:protein BCL9 homolog [Bactrocera tryoni]|uniref:protein BCL9 homolog n=1 Tax=Bactrocera tryoni TaxID=59916 RepID=UPI001A95DEB9|nr:protein BCL9 homolog [Bactrocera tryoni]